MLTETDLDKIRAYFPTSTGIQILVSGYAILLYEDAAEMKESWSSGVIGLDKKNPVCPKSIQNSSSDPQDLGEL